MTDGDKIVLITGATGRRAARSSATCFQRAGNFARSPAIPIARSLRNSRVKA